MESASGNIGSTGHAASVPEDRADAGVIWNFPLRVYHLRFEIVLEGPVRLPAYPGSAIRGLLGHGLKRLVCVTRQPGCRGCALISRCPYARFFETPGNAARKSPAPHPWLLRVEGATRRELAAGEEYVFGLVLLGREGVSSLPLLPPALAHAGRLGFGRERARFRLKRMLLETPLGSDRWTQLESTSLADHEFAWCAPLVPAVPGQVRLRFQTPFRVKHQGRLVRPGDFDVSILLRALRRRMLELVREYGEERDAWLDFPPLPESGHECLPGAGLAWHDWTRWSNRQKTHMQLGGLVGEIRIDLAGMADWWPWLWLGQWLHVGKQTSMGLGQYVIEAIDSQACDDPAARKEVAS